MNDLMIFEEHEVEVFELNGEVLFNPYHVGECLELSGDIVNIGLHFFLKNVRPHAASCSEA